jgi:hypothetical protein
MKHGAITTATPTIILGTKRHYIGAAPYTYPLTKGDTWSEYDTSDNFIEDWVYNGSFWISKVTYQYNFAPTLTIASNSTAYVGTFPLIPGTNKLLLNLTVSGFQSVAASSTSYWNFAIERIGSALVNISNFNTFTPIALASGSWGTLVFSINTLIDLATTGAKVLRIVESRPAGTSLKVFSYIIEYKKIRI